MGEFVFYFLGYVLFVGFLGAIFTRTEAFPGNLVSNGKYPDTLIFWVLGISATLAVISVLE